MSSASLPARALALALLLVSASATAQQPTPAPTADAAAARTAFERGVTALDESRFVDAVEFFRESYRLRPRPVVLNNLALAYRGLGRYREAIASFERYLTERGDRVTPQEAAQTRTEIERLRNDSPRLILRVTPPTATVLVDGEPASVPANSELLVDPSGHVLEVSESGYQTLQRSFNARPRDRINLELTLVPTATAPEASAMGHLLVVPNEARARVSIDGAEAGQGSVERELAVGAHRVTVLLPGFLPVERSVQIERSRAARVDVTLVPLAASGVRAPESSRLGWVLPVAIGGGALVVTGVVVGAVLGARAATPAQAFELGTWGYQRENQ